MVHEPAEVLREIKKSMGSILFSAQYQQAPEPARRQDYQAENAAILFRT
jgi:hypothetical protein